MNDQRNLEGDDAEETEDLFGFDGLQLAAKGAVATEEVETDSSESRFDESDDLFNFDELTAEADVLDDDVDISEILAEIPENEPDEEAKQAEVPVPPPPKKGLARRAAARTATEERTAAAPLEVPVGSRFSVRSGTTWMLVAFTLLNVGLIGLTWRMSSAVQDQVGEATRYIVQATNEIQAKAGERVVRVESAQQPVVTSDPSRHTTFALVRTDLDNGDFAMARRRLYSLLAVADRLDEEVRESVEARAQFMLADVAMGIALAVPAERAAAPIAEIEEELP